MNEQYSIFKVKNAGYIHEKNGNFPVLFKLN
jgi:hypothetical protein